MKRALAVAAVALMTATGLVATTTTSASAHGTHHSRSHSSDHRSHSGAGYTKVVVAPAVYNLVTSAGITPAPLAGATAAPFKGTLAARFPITAYRLRGLQIRHSGGISLTAGAATISLSNFNIDLGRGRVSGVVAGSPGDVGRVDLFKIRGTDRADLGLVRLTLTSTAAGALNATFGVNAFAENATFGYATPRPFARR
ncbi:hypothetical protein [Aeromicrobium wangtongii]|uniref:Uncharacterized protein n=1 Tax=Aeromicrobium wangtongii TaxID=2969247 RepID=A0ABY5MBD3_9ACTN|nr:hypothetical protein [Aeromicrobium wangtongii]MCD9197961.1 hypothetical protein [Aeromicrobium wangtongii]UUP15439.1 hypothetical protein NQV15_09030 [Aeromicrobium wangtongii]